MEQQIFQCHVSPTIEIPFGENFRKRWNLSKYHDPNSPAVMFGWYGNHEDHVFLQNHKGPIVMIWGGVDMNENRAQTLANRPETYQIAYGWVKRNLDSWGIKSKKLIIPVKDYSNFIPTPLGDKIYVYRGWNAPRNSYFKWEEVIKPLMNYFGEDKFIHGMGHDMDYVHENYYKNCFVYIKPNERGGSTAMWELGHMGRKTIAQNQGGAPNVLEYNNLDHIKQLIEEEPKKIGTIQTKVSDDTHSFMMNDFRWLNYNFWNGNR